MPTYNVTQIYFGTFNDFDPNESTTSDPNNQDNELENVSGWAPGQVFESSSLQLTNITQNDIVRQGRTDRLEENDFENRPMNPLYADSFTYDIGSGSVTSNIDSTFSWNVIVTLGDGTTQPMQITFIQLENGAVFSNDLDLAGLSIQSIELDTYHRGNYYGSGVIRPPGGG